MKIGWAIICGLVLIAAPMLAAQPDPACVKQAIRDCCQACGNMSCCAAQPGSSPQSVPANSTRTGTQIEFAVALSPVLIATVAAVESHPNSFSASAPLTATGVPLYTRNCALLL
jgi:hypothetical protein